MQLRPRHVARYSLELWKGWIGRMSTGAALLFLALGFIWNFARGGQLRYWLIAAFVCFLIASFSAWFRIRPDLRLEVVGVSLDAGISIEELDNMASYLTIRLYMVNTKKEDNEIRRYDLTIQLNDSKVNAQAGSLGGLMMDGEANGLIDLNEHRYFPLLQGRSRSGGIRFLIPGVDIERISNKKFVLIVTDAYGLTYKIKGIVPPDLTRDIVQIPPR